MWYKKRRGCQVETFNYSYVTHTTWLGRSMTLSGSATHLINKRLLNIKINKRNSIGQFFFSFFTKRAFEKKKIAKEVW